MGSDILLQATTGGIGAAVSTLVLYPLDAAKLRVQAQTKEGGGGNAKSKGTIDVMKDLYTENGIAGLFGGCNLRVFSQATQKGLYFYFFAAFQGLYTTDPRSITMVVNLVLGFLAAVADNAATLPLEVVNTRQTLNGEKTLDCAATIYKEDGVPGFFKGLSASIILCLNPAIQFAVFENMKSFLLQKGFKTLSTMQAFVVGAMSKAIATLMTYPIIRVKVLEQMKKKLSTDNENGASKGSDNGIISTLMQLLKSGGVTELYKGVGAQLTKGVLAAALMLMIKERLHSLAVALLRRDASTMRVPLPA